MPERQLEAQAPYTGAAGKTRSIATHLACGCGAVSSVALPRGVDAAAEPALAAEVRAGRHGLARCPRCNLVHTLDAAVIYHDPAARRFVLVLPGTARHRELDERAALWAELAADRASAVPSYVRAFEVVFGAEALVAALAAPAPGEASAVDPAQAARDAELAAREAELAARDAAQVARDVALAAREAELAAREADLAARDAALAAREAAFVDELPAEPTRLSVLAPEPVSVAAPPPVDDVVVGAAPARRPELVPGGTGDGAVRWAPVATPKFVAALAHARPHLTVQAFCVPEPVFVVTVSVGPLPMAAPDACVVALLDPGDAGDLAVLEALAARCAITLDLGEGKPRVVDAPLEDNVQLGLRVALDLLLTAPSTPAGFAAASARVMAPDFDRTGKRAATLAADSFAQLRAPGEIRVWLDVVAHWSEPVNERYLLLERALPATWWRTCRRALLERAVVIGLAIPPALVTAVIDGGLARSRKDLVSRLGRAFAASIEQGVDLDAAARRDNWHALKAEAAELGVTLEVSAAVPAAAAQPELPGEPTNRSLSTASEAELVALLDDKALRGDAAIELAQRSQPASIAPVFRALTRLTRGDASRLLPLLPRYGVAAVPQLIDGLRSKKGFVRHGSALALAVVGHKSGIAPLCAQLVDEPTELWRELARAVGALGAAALPALVGRVLEVALDRHERLAWAMAYVAAQDGQGELTALVRGRDALVSEVAKHGLELLAAAQRSDAEVRGRAPAAEQTVNRAFSRSFFDAVAAREGDAAPRPAARANTLRLPAALKPGAPVLAGLPEDDEEILDDTDILPG